MGLTNFIVTVAGVSAVVLLLRSDLKQSASIFRRNVRHIRQWLEEESSSASSSSSSTKLTDKAQPKDGASQIPQKDVPKERKD